MQKHVNLVDLVKSFPTNIYLQNLASIEKRTSPVKFAHLAEKLGKGSISNLSTKVEAPQVYTDRISGSIFYAVYGLILLFGGGLLLDRMGALRSGVIGLCLAILGGFTAKTFVWI